MEVYRRLKVELWLYIQKQQGRRERWNLVVTVKHRNTARKHQFQAPTKNVRHYSTFINHYRPQRSCGQGYVFTRVWFCSQGGGGLQVGRTPPQWETPPPRQGEPPQAGRHPPPRNRHPPGPNPPQDHPPGQGDTPRADTPPDQIPPSRDQTAPRKQTPAYSLRATGTHPTGMQSRLDITIPC